MISMSYGDLPTQEAFEAAFERELPHGTCTFVNDKRIGNDDLSCSELWVEIVKAQKEWSGDPPIVEEETSEDIQTAQDSAGDWCDSVLYSFGFEWD